MLSVGNKVNMGGDVYDTNFMSRCQKLKVRVFIVSHGISMNEIKCYRTQNKCLGKIMY